MNDIKLPPIFPIRAVQNLPPELKPMGTKFILDAEFFSQLIVRLQDKENHRRDLFRSTYARKRAPRGWVKNESKSSCSFTNLGESIISQLIESVFWASLERDEGRALRFAVA